MADRGGLDGLVMSRVDSSAVQSRGMGSYQRRKGSEANYAPYELREQGVGDTNVAKSARLYEESVGYKNLANDPDVAMRAKYAVLADGADIAWIAESKSTACTERDDHLKRRAS